MRIPTARTSTATCYPPTGPGRMARATLRALVPLAMLAVAGCGGGEATVTTDLGLSRLVSGQGVDLAQAAQQAEADALRASAQVVASDAPATAGAPTAVPAAAAGAPLPSITGSAPASIATTPTAVAAGAATLPAPGLPSPGPAPTSAPTAAISGTPPAPGATAVAPSAAAVAAATTVPAPITAEALAQGEGSSLELLNQLRTAQGLPGLVRDATMDAVARDWSRQMAETGGFEHSTSPYGENIAFTSDTSLSASQAADTFHRLWIESPDHLKNMTSPYTKVGIGVFRTDRGWYGTHVYSY